MSKRVIDVGNCGPDHAAIRRLIEGNFDAQVAAADDLKSALAQLDKSQVDLVLVNRKLDLDYSEDKDAEVDMNLVMTGAGQFVEVQGTGEEATFTRTQLDRLLKLGKLGIDAITERQAKALGSTWPWE